MPFWPQNLGLGTWFHHPHGHVVTRWREGGQFRKDGTFRSSNIAGWKIHTMWMNDFPIEWYTLVKHYLYTVSGLFSYWNPNFYSGFPSASHVWHRRVEQIIGQLWLSWPMSQVEMQDVVLDFVGGHRCRSREICGVDGQDAKIFTSISSKCSRSVSTVVPAWRIRIDVMSPVSSRGFPSAVFIRFFKPWLSDFAGFTATSGNLKVWLILLETVQNCPML